MKCVRNQQKKSIDIWTNIQRKIYFTRYETNFGMSNFAKCKGRQWFDWDKKQYFDRSHQIEPEILHFKNESSKPN